MLESLCNKVAGLYSCKFIKKRLQHKRFPINIAKYLKSSFFYRTHLVAALKRYVGNLSELHHEEQKSILLSYSGIFIDKLDHVHNWVGCFS